MKLPLYKILGYAGALPFIGCTFAVVTAANIQILLISALIQIIYAGLIASFLGGIHWPQALQAQNTAQMLWAMLPSILFLFLIPTAFLTSTFSWPLIIAAFAFLGLYISDKHYLDISQLPDGYMKFRLRITSIVCASLLASAVSFWS